MKRQVYAWHGLNQPLLDDLIKLVGCYTEEHDGNTVPFFDGTLDEFYARWKRSVMVLPQRGLDNGDLICVTHHSHFGQR